jgi:predicted GNAT family N-acyltransferase
MNRLEIREVSSEVELQAVLRVREEVFVKGQGVSRDIEMDGYDASADHVAVLLDGEVIGCARVRLIDNAAKLERIAIVEKHRGKRYGEKLVKFLIDRCLQKRVHEVYMNSQFYVKDYYRRFGFEEVGTPFSEAGIKHIKMVLRTSNAS